MIGYGYTCGFHIIVAQRGPVRIHDNKGPLSKTLLKGPPQQLLCRNNYLKAYASAADPCRNASIISFAANGLPSTFKALLRALPGAISVDGRKGALVALRPSSHYLKAHVHLPPAPNCTTERLGAVIGPSWAALETLLGPTWDLLGLSWGLLDPLGRFEAAWDSHRVILDGSCGLLGTSWDSLGASWAS